MAKLPNEYFQIEDWNDLYVDRIRREYPHLGVREIRRLIREALDAADKRDGIATKKEKARPEGGDFRRYFPTRAKPRKASGSKWGR